ncbi:MAG: hypothetical protein ACK57O_11840, partial [Planctomyces sp.]
GDVRGPQSPEFSGVTAIPRRSGDSAEKLNPVELLTVRAPDRKRQFLRVIQPPPPDVDMADVAARVSYTGSPEHKHAVTFAGNPRPRADATICDSSFAKRLAEIQLWLRAAIRMQCCGGPWENGFPRCVWYKAGDTVFQGRLVNRVSGQYKGWQLVVPDDGNRVAQCE